MYTGFYVFNVFFAFKMTKSQKQEAFQRNKDPIGTLISKKVPIGSRVPKQGPNRQQWNLYISAGRNLYISSEGDW